MLGLFAVGHPASARVVNGDITFSKGTSFYNIHPDGTHQTTLTSSVAPYYPGTYSQPYNGGGSDLQYTAGGKTMLFFGSYGGGNVKTALMDADSGATRPLAVRNADHDYSTMNFSMSLSPDGSSVIAWYDGVWMASLAAGDDTVASKLVNIPTDEGECQIAWSPTGDTILASTYSDLYTLNADGTSVRKVLTGGIAAPNWSQDGKKIVFIRKYDIYTVNKDGSGLKRVTNTAHDPKLEDTTIQNVGFAPDGGRIVFSAGVEKKQKTRSYIFTIKPNGKGLKTVTNSAPGESNSIYGVAWRPIVK